MTSAVYNVSANVSAAIFSREKAQQREFAMVFLRVSIYNDNSR